VNSVPQPKKPRHYDDWEVRDAFECLMRGKQIERDPALMAKIKKLAQDRMAAVNSIANKPLPKK
jgi:hypothetical protein